MTLEQSLCELVEPHLEQGEGLSAIGFALCWPNDSALGSRLEFELHTGETVAEAAERLDLSWSPGWLIDGGYTPFDADGVCLLGETPATADGMCKWTPHPRLCRVDDQTSDYRPPRALARRLSGEVALASLWGSASRTYSVPDHIRPVNLNQNTRGARFKNMLVYILQKSLPAGWRVEPEVHLTRIRGLHMRRDVGDRRSDIIVVDEGNRLIAVVSSKWTWRSDRGTEAAQMVPLMRYRPDVPYTMVTAEFPRAKTVSRESVEDRAYHLCPEWVGSWQAIYAEPGSPRVTWPRLSDLRTAGNIWSEAADLPGIPQLIEDLRASGTIL